MSTECTMVMGRNIPIVDQYSTFFFSGIMPKKGKKRSKMTFRTKGLPSRLTSCLTYRLTSRLTYRLTSPTPNSSLLPLQKIKPKPIADHLDQTFFGTCLYVYLASYTKHLAKYYNFIKQIAFYLRGVIPKEKHTLGCCNIYIHKEY